MSSAHRQEGCAFKPSLNPRFPFEQRGTRAEFRGRGARKANSENEVIWLKVLHRGRGPGLRYDIQNRLGASPILSEALYYPVHLCQIVRCEALHRAGTGEEGFQALSFVASTRRGLAISLLALLIMASLATGRPALAQDDTRTKQLRLLCATLSGDLTDPGGIAAFRRCLTARDPLNEIRRDNQIGTDAKQTAGRPGAASPSGYGGNSRNMLAEGIQRFQITDGKIAYVIDNDRKLWRSALVQTFGINETNARDHCAAQAARTAFQTAGVLLSLIRSLPSVN